MAARERCAPERHLVGSLSPFNGGLPTPARFRMPSAFRTSPRAARSRKYSSVRSADSFSATATLMN